MWPAKDAHGRAYAPPSEAAHHLDKQYEYRKRKVDDNLYQGQADVSDRVYKRSRTEVDNILLPPRPSREEMTVLHFPADWSSMSVRDQKAWRLREHQRLNDARMQKAIDNVHLFQNASEAAKHFRVSISTLNQTLHRQKQGRQQPSSGHHAQRARPSKTTAQHISEPKTVDGQKGPESSDDNVRGQLPRITAKDLRFIPPPSWGQMPKKEQEEYRRSAQRELRESRLKLAVECYKQKLFTDIEQGARHFHISYKMLMKELGLPKSSEDQKTVLNSTEKENNTTSCIQTQIDRSSNDAGSRPLDLASHDIASTDLENSWIPDMAIESSTPFSANEESDLVDEIKKRADSNRLPSISKIRDIANARLIEREGLNTPIVPESWVHEFIKRHEYLQNIYSNNTINSASETGPSALLAPSHRSVPAAEATAASDQETSRSSRSHASGVTKPLDIGARSPLPTSNQHFLNPGQNQCNGDILSRNSGQLLETTASLHNSSVQTIETRFRITYNDDTRIIALEPDVQFSALMKRVTQKFGTTRPVRLLLADGDGMITIGDQEDLNFVLVDTRKWAAKEGKDVVQLQVSTATFRVHVVVVMSQL